MIGITSYAQAARWGAWELPAALVPLHYVDSVEQAGGRALVVPPSEDAIEAMSEVSNNLSGAFNQLPDAIRIRVKPIEPMNPEILDWLMAADHKMQLEVVGGLGNLFLFSR